MLEAAMGRSGRPNPHSSFREERVMSCMRMLLPMFTLWALVTAAPAQECVDYADYLYREEYLDNSYLRNVYSGGALVAEGGLVLAADESDGLGIVDASDPRDLRYLGGADAPNTAKAVGVSGSYAYVGGDYGFWVADISDPEVPIFVGSLDVPGETVLSVAIAGGYAYAGCSDSLHVIDISTPESPSAVAAVDVLIACGVEVVGDYLYVAEYYEGLKIYDVSNPLAPVLAGTRDTPGYARSVAVADTFAYVADGTSGLQVINVADPSSPVIVGSVDTPGNAFDVVVIGSRAFVADYEGGLQAIDISDPEDPFVSGHIEADLYAVALVAMGEHVCVADRGFGLEVIRITDVETPPDELGSVTLPNSYVGKVTVDGTRAYVSTTAAGLCIVDVADPEAPAVLGLANTPGQARDAIVDEDYAYIADGYSLQVADVSNPYSPAIIGSIEGLSYTFCIAKHGDVVYVQDDVTESLLCIDVSDPSAPMIVGGVETTGQTVNDIGYSQGHVFLAAYDSGLIVVDVSDPSAPRVVARDESIVARSLAVAGNNLYVLASAPYSYRLAVLDITDPEDPQLLSDAVAVAPTSGGIAVAGRHVYASGYYGGFHVIDVSDPSDPQPVGGAVKIAGVEYGEGAKGLCFSGDQVYQSANVTGLHVFPRQCGLAAEFDAEPLAGYGDVQFTDRSSGDVTSWTWDFGDSTTSGEQHPLHSYAAPGTYSVSLTVENPGDSHTLLKRECVTVLPSEVIANFYASTYLGQSPLTVDFIDKTTGAVIDSIRWDFDDGETATESRPSHVFTEAGDYDVTLVAFGPANADTMARRVEVRAEEPVIQSVTDIPGDQGGHVYLDVLRSAYDDDPLRDIEIYTVQRRDNGDWVNLLSAGAYGESHYYFEARTLADSTAGDPALAEFRVIAFMMEGGFASDSATGYSVDNIAPEAPGGLGAVGGVEFVSLSWDTSGEEDFSYYAVYRDTLEGFEPETPIGYATDPTFDDLDPPAGVNLWYRVTAVDAHGNESDPSESVAPDGTGIVDEPPARFYLGPAVPNPFNPTTTIAYWIPEWAAGQDLTLRIYDVRGRLVRTLLDGGCTPGRRCVVWDGRDDRGAAAASGVYLYRMEAGEFRADRKMMLLK